MKTERETSEKRAKSEQLGLGIGESGVQRADEIGDAGYVMAGAPLLESLGEALGGAGIGVAGGADLDGGGSGEQEFDRVFGE